MSEKIVDLSDLVDIDDMPNCPLCDCTMEEDDPCGEFLAHGVVALAHVFCIYEKRNEGCERIAR